MPKRHDITENQRRDERNGEESAKRVHDERLKLGEHGRSGTKEPVVIVTSTLSLVKLFLLGRRQSAPQPTHPLEVANPATPEPRATRFPNPTGHVSISAN